MYAVAQPHEHSETDQSDNYPVVAERCLCIDSENVMATAEQMQEALQQQQNELQVLGARMAALETESVRAQKAEQEKSTLIQSTGAMRTDRGGAMVDTKGIGQPFMPKGTVGQDFGEWTHKVRTFMLGRFGDDILGAPTWASRQRKNRCQRLRTFADKPHDTLD